jgi:nitroreductase
MLNIIDNFHWRYATKLFDPEQKVAEQDLEAILETVRLSASSYGLQPYAYRTDINQAYLDQFIEDHTKIRQAPVEEFAVLKAMIQGSVLQFSQEEKDIWASRQTYIALGNSLAAAAELKIDACPMEGFLPEIFDDILGLNSRALKSVALVALGYRSKDDDLQHAKKVRKSKEELFTRI